MRNTFRHQGDDKHGMVRLSSNLKKPKAVIKQSTPLLSKEAPCSNISAASLSYQKRLQLQQSSHSHSRSLPTNSTAVQQEEIGLTSGQVLKKLIEEIDRILNQEKLYKINTKFIFIMRLFSLLLLAVWSVHVTGNWRLGLFCSLVFFIEFFFIQIIENKRASSAVRASIKAIRKKMRELDKSFLAGTIEIESLYSINFRVPVSSATSYTRVIRDGKIRLVCLNLLVPGDFVVLLPGEKSVSFNFQLLKLLLPANQRKNMGLSNDVTVVKVEEFPMTQIIKDQLKCPRRNQFIFSMLQEKFQSILSTLIVLGCLKDNFSVPLIILSSPIIHFLWWLIGSCYLSILADQLIRSETPFAEAVQDSHDLDEFDEDAPPPVKNIKIAWWRVCFEVIKRLLGKQGRGAILRFWDGDVIEALALTSVLCFTDREGPISNPHSRPCELIVPTMDELELVAVELVPTISDPQKVQPSLNNPILNLVSDDLRAIGLSMLLSSECGGAGCLESKPHCRHDNILKEFCHFLPEYLQTCYCNLAEEIGFDSSILNRFKKVKTIWHQHTNHTNTNNKNKKTSTISVLIEDLNSSAVFIGEKDVPVGHLFTFGRVQDILMISSHALSKSQDESKVTGLSDSLKRKLIDFEGTMRSCDVHCVAFSYRPIFEDENEVVFDKLVEKQVFLGIVSACPEPKQHFQEFIDDLEAAGVRFAYFSPLKEQPSKAFGERLGLETDWNSCILLSEHPNPASQSPGYSALSDIKARLPRGIQAIRPHLESVDDIPLHVSIFAECNSQNSAEMVKIYQESGEVVTAIGSCRSIRNSKCFGTAHFSIGSDLFKTTAENSFDSIAFDLNSNSVKLILPADSSPYIMTELIRESRTILQNSINAWEFITGTVSSLILIGMTSTKSIDISESLSILFSLFFVGIGIVLGPYDPLVMKTHSTVLDSSKCPDYIKFSFFVTCSFFSLIRFGPSLISLVIIRYFCFNSRVYLGYLIILLVQACPFVHSYETLDYRRIYLNYPKLTIAFIISCSFNILFVLFDLKSLKELINLMGLLIISLCLGLICVIWQESIKSVHFKDYYEQAQKRAKLLFNTKLGMHSPV